MIEVKVTLKSAIHHSRDRELMTMTICNDGREPSNPARGSYWALVFHKGSTSRVLRRGRVENFPRKSYHVGRLILRALKSCFPEEK